MTKPVTAMSLLAAALVASPRILASGQIAPPRYHSAQLACAMYTETVRTTIRGASGSATVQDRAGRDGLIVVRGRDSAAAMVLEAWYDSLSVWRGDAAAREAPDPDGVIGGRFRGVLATDGWYRSIKEPFVPEEVAQVAELATALDDFFPRLPAVGLPVGGQWSDSGRVIRRATDRREGTIVAQRYAWQATGRRGDRYPAGDTLAVTLDQAIDEEGEVVWSPEYGPLSWWRQIKVIARIPATGGVRRAIRSIVDQRIEVIRRFGCDERTSGRTDERTTMKPRSSPVSGPPPASRFGHDMDRTRS